MKTTFKLSPANAQGAERFLAWLENRIRQDELRCGWPITLDARIEESAEGFFRIEGTESYNDMTFRL
jgi:hypothetical protein